MLAFIFSRGRLKVFLCSVFPSCNKSVSKKHHAAAFISQVEQQRQSCSSGDDKLQQTLALTMSRLQQYQQEFELLYLSLSSARVFFRGDWAASSSSSSSGDSQKSDTQSISSDSSGKEKPLNKGTDSNS